MVCLRNICINTLQKGDNDEDDDNDDDDNDDDDNNNNNNNNNNNILATYREALNQGATKYSHAGHCMHNSENTNVKVQTFNMGYNITHNMNCTYRTAATL
jgi:TATA-binding protein-associated factor Taf7